MLSSVLFPFLPWLVRDLGVPADSVALYSGLLSSAFNVSSLAGAVVWGRLSDVHGRLPVLALGLGSNAVSMVLLGLSASFPQAVAARLVAGCLNGNAGIARAAMREMTTEETRAHGFGLMSLAYGVGFFLGTNIGGLLAQPAELVPSLLAGSLLDRFPYLLPCAIATSGRRGARSGELQDHQFCRVFGISGCSSLRDHGCPKYLEGTRRGGST